MVGWLRGWLRSSAIRTKLMVSFLAIALLAFGPLSVIYLNILRGALTDRAHQALYAAASRTAVSLNVFIDNNLDSLRAETHLPELVDYLSLPFAERPGSSEEQKAMETLEALRLKDFLYISSYAIVDKSGANILDTFTPNVGHNELDDDCVQEALRTERPTMSSVKFAQDAGDVSFCFSSPVRDAGGQIAGVLRLRYSIAILQDIVYESHGLVGADSFAILLDENYLRLTHDNRPDLIFKTVVPLDAKKQAELQANGRLPNLPAESSYTNLPAFQKGLDNVANQPFFQAEADDADSDIEEIAVVSLQKAPWYIAYAQPQTVFLAPIMQAIRTILLVAGVTAVFIILAALNMVRWLSYPITRLNHVAERIATGDLTAQAPVFANDEIGKLAITFNGMTRQLQTTIYSWQLRSAQLSQEVAERQRTETALQEAKEIAEAANEAKSAFLANMTHELRTPLHAILGYTQMLTQYNDLSKQQRDGLSVIQSSGEHLLMLINDILDLSKIEAGEMALFRKPFHFPTFLQNISDIIRMKVEQKELVFEFMPYDFVRDKPGGALVTAVYGDEVRLRQVLLNLLDNAIKFTPTGTINLKVGHPSKAALQIVRFLVEDTGIGIAKEELENIFNPFQRANTHIHAEGTGLGLAISQHLIQLMGSELMVESTLDVGSKFWFDIDLAVITTDTVTEIVAGGTSSKPVLAVPPPQEYLERLYTAAKLGDIAAISDQLSILEQTTANYSTFIMQFRKLIENFQIDKMCSILQHYNKYDTKA